MQFKPFKIGKYLLLERLATGGMAEVYRAKASGAGGFEKQLAIKRIIPSYAENEEFRRMFEYEARLSSLLSHANIVHVYDFVKSGDTYLLALEFVDGKNLRQVVNKAKKANFPLPIEFGAFIINEVCKGLDYAHNLKDGYQGKHLNVIHRDMSPQNIMISYDGAVKIVDFGIAKARDRVDETRSGVIKGKFGYMSPEQASGQEIDHRSDIFSTVIILYELLTNKRLFASENDMATLKRIQECIVQRPSLINPKVNSSLEKIILKGLTKDRSLRYQQAGELQQKLQEYVNKYHSSFNQNSVQHLMTKLFRAEMEQEKRRLEQVYQQSIPYSQQQRKEEPDDIAGLDIVLDGEQTKSEHEPDSLVTKVSDPSIPAPNKSSATDNLFAQNPPAEEGSAPPTVGKEQTDSAILTQLGDQEDSKTINPVDPGSLTPSQVSPDSASATLRGPAEDATLVKSPQANDDKTAVSDATSDILENNEKEESFTVAPISEAPPANNPLEDQSIQSQKIELKLETESTIEPEPKSPRLGSFARALKPKKKPPKDPHFGKKGRSLPPDLQAPMGPTRSFGARVARLLSSAIVLSALAGTLYYYFSIEEPDYVPPQERDRTTSAVPQQSTNPTATPSTRLAPGEKPCVTKVDSDPRGANVRLNGKIVGQTPTVAFVICNKAAQISIELDGYQATSEKLTVRRPKQSYYRTLKRIPVGILEITLAQNASVYLDGNLLNKPAQAGVPYRIKVRADEKHTLVFFNEPLKLRVQREYFVKENEVKRDRIRLFSNKKKTKKNRRPTNRRRRR